MSFEQFGVISDGLSTQQLPAAMTYTSGPRQVCFENRHANIRPSGGLKTSAQEQAHRVRIGGNSAEVGTWMG